MVEPAPLSEPLRTVESLGIDPLIEKAIIAGVGLVILYVIVRGIRVALARNVDDKAARYRARKAVATGGVLLAVLMLATIFSERLGGLTVALGVAGAGIAFALQEIIVSIAGWLAITFGGFYKVGDRVMLGGIRGDVIDIRALRTTLFEAGEWVQGDLYNGRVVRVANSFVFKEPVFNYSAEFPFLWDEIQIPVRHDSDRVLARTILEETLDEIVGEYAKEVSATWEDLTRNYVIERARITPQVTMVMDQNWLTFTLRYVVDYRKRRSTRDAVFTAILERFDATDMRVRVATTAQEVTVVQPLLSHPQPTESPARQT